MGFSTISEEPTTKVPTTTVGPTTDPTTTKEPTTTVQPTTEKPTTTVPTTTKPTTTVEEPSTTESIPPTEGDTTTDPITTETTTEEPTTTDPTTTEEPTTTDPTTTEEPTTTVQTTTEPTTTVQTTTVQTTTEQTPTGAGGDCNLDDFEADDNGNCFLVVTTKKLNWSKAKTACKALGDANLATIEDSTANTFIKGKLSANAWTGATDVKKEGTWKWTNGDTFSFSKWKDSNDDDDKDCAYIASSNGKWYDEDCTEKMHYVCMET